MTLGMSPEHPYSRLQTTTLVALRMLIGWHFLYEGLAKIGNPYWSSAGYLDGAQWWLGGLFRNLAASATAVTIIDYVNMWGLTLIGLGLMLGLLTRTATIAGIVLLALYYLAAPPFVGLEYSIPTEGSYIVVNKVLIEAVALIVLFAFPTGRIFGLDRFVTLKRGTAHRAAPAQA
jgi:thiosulfate dehydrogenase [quinone] large subunit